MKYIAIFHNNIITVLDDKGNADQYKYSNEKWYSSGKVVQNDGINSMLWRFKAHNQTYGYVYPLMGINKLTDLIIEASQNGFNATIDCDSPLIISQLFDSCKYIGWENPYLDKFINLFLSAFSLEHSKTMIYAERNQN